MHNDDKEILEIRLSEDSLKFAFNPSKCPVTSCSYIIRGVGKIPKHLSEFHKLYKEIYYFCPFEGCKFGGLEGTDRHFTSVKLLKQHYYKVHAEKKFKCEKCGVGFGMCNLRNYHQATCGMNFQCGECSCKYTSLISLTSHCQTKGHRLPTSFTERNFKEKRIEKRPLELREIPMEACSISPAVSEDHSYSGAPKINEGHSFVGTPQVSEGQPYMEAPMASEGHSYTKPPVIPNGVHKNMIISNTFGHTQPEIPKSQTVHHIEKTCPDKGVVIRKETDALHVSSSKHDTLPTSALRKDIPSTTSGTSNMSVQNIPALVMINMMEKIPVTSDVSSSLKPILPKPSVTIIPIDGKTRLGSNKSFDSSLMTSCDTQTEEFDTHGDLVSAGIQTSISFHQRPKKAMNMVTGGTQTSGDLILRRAMESADLPVEMASVGTQISGQSVNRNISSSQTQTITPSNTRRRRKDQVTEGSSNSGKSPPKRRCSRSTSFIPILPNSASAGAGYMCLEERKGLKLVENANVRVYQSQARLDSALHNSSFITEAHNKGGVGMENSTSNRLSKNNVEIVSGKSGNSDLGTVLSIPDSVIDGPSSKSLTNACKDNSESSTQSSVEADILLHSDGLSQILNQSQDMAIQTFDEDFQRFLQRDNCDTDTSIKVSSGMETDFMCDRPLADFISMETQTRSQSKDSCMQTQTIGLSDCLTHSQTQTHLMQNALSTNIETQTINSSDLELTSSQTQTSLLQIGRENGDENNILTDASTSMENVFSNIQTQTAADDFLTNIQTQTVSDFDVLDLFMNSIETQTHNDSFLDEFSFSHIHTQTSIDFRNQSTGTQTPFDGTSSCTTGNEELSLASIQTQTTNKNQDNFSTSTQTFRDFSFDFPSTSMQIQTVKDSSRTSTEENVSTQTSFSDLFRQNMDKTSESTQTMLITPGGNTSTGSETQAMHTQTNLVELDDFLTELHH